MRNTFSRPAQHFWRSAKKLATAAFISGDRPAMP
jgi:hypothetical protein